MRVKTAMEFKKKISVIMPFYNTPVPILREAIESILNQTFRDFELVIIDDCSTDESADYLKSINDERVRIIRNTVNLGVTKSLNVGLSEAKGKYIARMDSDDISFPERLQKEYEYMEAHPDTVMCGSRVELFGSRSGFGIKPINDTEIYRATLLFRYPGPMHPTIFLRHEALLTYGVRYNENLKYAQDYDLYAKVTPLGKIYIFPEPLLKYRTHEKQISSTGRDIQMECAKATQRRLLAELLGDISEKELEMHYTHSCGYDLGCVINEEIAAWYDKIAEANKTAKIYDQKKLEKVIVSVKESLVKAFFTQDRGIKEKLRTCLHYLPFLSVIHVSLSVLKSCILDRKGGGHEDRTN